MLYIKVVNGQPEGHPIDGKHLLDAYPEIKKTGLPPEYVKFERVARPTTQKVYKVWVNSYGWNNGIVTDVWTERDMTQEERNAKVGTYINTITGQYPLHEGDIRLEHPEITEDMTGATFPCPPMYAKVVETDPPATDGTLYQFVEQLPPVQINGIWTQQWELKTRTQKQVQAITEKMAELGIPLENVK
jgi:hypothetical protein